MRVLVLGGIRSGKSQWAESAIAGLVGVAEPVRYVATGSGFDAEWTARVDAHRRRRPAHWSTVESDDLPRQLRAAPAAATLVDDVGGWLTAVMDRRGAWAGADVDHDIAEDTADLIAAVAEFASPLALVSPEVGLTVVPATESGRRFADELGTLNQRLAALCDRVVLVVAGRALALKDCDDQLKESDDR